MLDCHSPNEDFLQTDGADLSASLLFSVNFETTPNISSLASFYSPRRKCTERLGASLHAFITFRHSRADPEIFVGMRGRGAKPL